MQGRKQHTAIGSKNMIPKLMLFHRSPKLTEEACCFLYVRRIIGSKDQVPCLRIFAVPSTLLDSRYLRYSAKRILINNDEARYSGDPEK
jgi:hypothetical protein